MQDNKYLNGKKIHRIELDVAFCDDVVEGRKCFEIRNNDRGYQAGDLVSFMPYDGYTSSFHAVDHKLYEITYVLSGHGLKENFVVFGIKPYTNLPKDYYDFDDLPRVYFVDREGDMTSE